MGTQSKGPRLNVEFGEHISADRVASMVSSMAAYGNVFDGHSQRAFVVEVFRRSKLPGLQRQLLSWENHGFLRWSEDTAELG
jgi:hypothetical protein